jgi:hypothetical protein
VEIVFNEVQASAQYPGSLALRFARVNLDAKKTDPLMLRKTDPLRAQRKLDPSRVNIYRNIHVPVDYL